MDMMCDAYKGPGGDNLCRALTEDPKCQIDESMTVHESIATALWSPPGCAVGEELAHKLCECSCWSRIVQVYTPMFTQWSEYDDEVEAKRDRLRSMCIRDVEISAASYFSESTTTQCGLNTLTVTIDPSKPLPKGSVITIKGLNGENVDKVELHSSSSSELANLTWTPAHCLDWCSKSGFCPESGSARDTSCLARPTDAVDLVTSKRCMRWCDSDAHLTVTLSETSSAFLTLSVNILNPSFKQMGNAPSLSISGPGVYAAPKDIVPADPNKWPYDDGMGALSAAMPPTFDIFQIGESPCDGKLDPESNTWRGSCAGMVNTLTMTLKPNLEIYAGAILIIKGLVRSGSVNSSPTVRFGADESDPPNSYFAGVTVDDWQSDDGILTLRVLEGGAGIDIPRIAAGSEVLIALDFLMPSIVDSDGPKPPVTIKVERAGYHRDCFFMERASNPDQFLVAKSPFSNSFKVRKISSSTCFPGECNEITVAIMTNTVLQSEMGVTISIIGLSGMDMSDTCNPRSTCANAADDELELKDAIADSNHRNLFQSIGNNTAMATWDVQGKRLSMRLAKGAQLDAYKEYSFKFKLRNGYVAADLADNIKVTAMTSDGKCLASKTLMAVDGKCDVSAEKMCASSATPGLSCPNPDVKVCAPGFLIKDIGQSFPWPGCDVHKNNVTVTLQPNVKIDVGSVIKLRNFLGPKDYTKHSGFCGKSGCAGSSFYPRGACSISERKGNCTCSSAGDASCVVPQPCNNAVFNCSNTTESSCLCMIRAVQLREAQSHNTTFVWDDEMSEISLTVTNGDPLLAGIPYYLNFTVTNPVLPQDSPLISVDAVTSAFVIGQAPLRHDFTTVPIANRSSQGEAAALLVLKPQFLVKNIGQNNPYPNALNRITVTLIPNIALGGLTNITIEGLEGSDTFSTSSMSITQTSPSSRILSHNGTWAQDSGRLVLQILNTSKWRVDDEAIIFSFEIMNPGRCHASPDVGVGASVAGTDCAKSIPFEAGNMLKDSTSVPFEKCRACDTQGDRCEACRSCEQKCDQSDAHPLKVHAPAFVIKQIGQSTTWPGSVNTITVTFATNIDFTSAAAIFVSGFHGGTAQNGTIAIISNFSHLTTAEWNQAEKLLYVNVGSPGTKSGANLGNTTYTFSFKLTNALTSQRSPLINIWAFNAGTCRAPVPKCSMDRPADVTKQPLTIDAPGFLLKEIGHATQFASALNTITATLSLNFELLRPSKVTIMGIMGRQTQSNEALAVTTVSGSLFKTVGRWDQDTGSLILILKENTIPVPGANYSISFDVTNPPIAQNAPLVSVSAEGAEAVLMDGWDALKVISPEIVTAKIGQSTAAPSALNLITVTLRSNAPISSASSGAFTIKGFKGFEAKTGPIALMNSNSTDISVLKASRDGTPGTGWWNGAAGNSKQDEEVVEEGWGDRGDFSTPPQSLVLLVAGTIEQSRDYIFSFQVLNGNCQTNCPDIDIETNGLEFIPASCGADVGFLPSDVPKVMSVTQDFGAACAGKVYAPMFTTKMISECSKVNSNPNTLTVTLVSNVDLVKGSKISISGLRPQSNVPQDVDVGGRDGSMFSTLWNHQQGVLMLQVRDDPGIALNQEIVFNFMLTNPDFEADQLQPSVGAESEDIIIGESTMSGLVLGAGDEPKLTTKDIAESSTVQRSWNTLMMIIESNAKIPERSVVKISNLQDLIFGNDGIKLSGMHSYYFDDNIKWNKEDGVLELTVISAIPAEAKRMIALEVKNFETRQEAQRPKISVGCPRWVEGCPDAGFSISETSMGTREGVLSSMTPGEFLVRKIGQRTPYPGESNTLTLTIASTVDYRHSWQDGELIIEVSGLDGAKAKRGPIELAGAHPFLAACWECTCPSLGKCDHPLDAPPHAITFHVAAGMTAGRSYVLAFDIVNPSRVQDAPDVKISAMFRKYPFQATDLREVAGGAGWAWGSSVLFEMMRDEPVSMQQDDLTKPKNIYNSEVGEAQALKVRDAIFDVRNIAQTQPYPCATNTICVTLKSSVPLTVQKESYFVLQTFVGAIAPVGEIALFSNVNGSGEVTTLQSAFENGNQSKGVWSTNECEGAPGKMCAALWIAVSCRIEAGTEISFCIKVKNPAQPQQGPDTMTIFSSDGNSYQDLEYSKKLLSLPYASMEDPRPMYIRSPEFKMLEIEQSSPFPLDQNTIQLSFKTNVIFLFAVMCVPCCVIAGMCQWVMVRLRTYTDSGLGLRRAGAFAIALWISLVYQGIGRICQSVIQGLQHAQFEQRYLWTDC